MLSYIVHSVRIFYVSSIPKNLSLMSMLTIAPHFWYSMHAVGFVCFVLDCFCSGFTKMLMNVLERKPTSEQLSMSS